MDIPSLKGGYFEHSLLETLMFFVEYDLHGLSLYL